MCESARTRATTPGAAIGGGFAWPTHRFAGWRCGSIVGPVVAIGATVTTGGLRCNGRVRSGGESGGEPVEYEFKPELEFVAKGVSGLCDVFGGEPGEAGE